MAKTIIVTGASRGIGAAITECLVKHSGNVVLIARGEAALEAMRVKYPSQIRFLVGDLSDFSLAKKAVDIALKEFGCLDGLVVNHATLSPVTDIETCEIEDWKRLFDVNFFSAVAFSKAALPALRTSAGSILFTSSGVSTGAYKAWGAYGSSKAAINHLAMQLGCEEPNVTSIAVRPGVVDTDMQRELRDVHFAVMAPKDNEKFLGLYHAGKLLRADQPGNVIAKMVLDPPKELSGKYVDWESPDLARFHKS